MTRLLEKAIAAAQETSADVQDAIASLILAELHDEEAWQEAFSTTGEDQWEQMTKVVRDEIAAGRTDPLDELLN